MHRNRHFAPRALAAAALLSLLSVGPARAELYGFGSNSGGLYRIDEATGDATFALPVNNGGSLVGLEFVGDRFYAVDVFGSNGFAFGSIDPVTGAFTEINNQGDSFNWHGLAYHNDDGVFYTVNLDTPNFALTSVALDGAITTGGDLGLFIAGLAYDDANNVLYASDGGSLYTLDVSDFSNPVATFVGSHNAGLSNIVGLAYDPDSSTLYLNSGNEGAQNLYTIDVSTGEAALVGDNTIPFGVQLDGLAWAPAGTVVPGPEALPLFGGGLTALGLLLRRRRA